MVRVRSRISPSTARGSRNRSRIAARESGSPRRRAWTVADRKHADPHQPPHLARRQEPAPDRGARERFTAAAGDGIGLGRGGVRSRPP